MPGEMPTTHSLQPTMAPLAASAERILIGMSLPDFPMTVHTAYLLFSFQYSKQLSLQTTIFVINLNRVLLC